jgi:hypothetical protein
VIILKRLVVLIAFLILISLVACQKDIPEPESLNTITVFAESVETYNKDPFQVKYFVRGNDVYVECLINQFSFRGSDKKGIDSGKISVYVDGKKMLSISSAAFIIKDLEKGNHRIGLQLEKNNGEKTTLQKEFVISIP